jgi:hypothetical protein
MKKFACILLCAALTAFAAQPATRPAARPAAAPETSDRLNAVKENVDIIGKKISQLKLSDGTVLTDVTLTAFVGDEAVLNWTEGKGKAAKTVNLRVPITELPPEFRPAQSAQPTVIVKQGLITAPAPRADPNAPLVAPKQIYSGRITLPSDKGPVTPQPGVLVLAVRQADYAAYNRERLAKHGAAIDAAQKKMSTTTDPRQRAAAAREALQAVYDSFGAPPPPVAADETTENGSFRLERDDPGTGAVVDLQVVIIARVRVPAGNGFLHYVWTEFAGAGGRTLLTEENILSR